ncbi:hypothetical protein BH11MYX2_BH11MYX2_00250 [soil metagenome]
MFSRALTLGRFVRYALRFERAFKTDGWDDVRACFADNASYEVVGTGTVYDGITHGNAAIATALRSFVTEVDRKYDKRQPRAVGLPRFDDKVLVLQWSVRYVMGTDSRIITGTTRCTFENGKIIKLHDAMHADECARWLSLAALQH